MNSDFKVDGLDLKLDEKEINLGRFVVENFTEVGLGMGMFTASVIDFLRVLQGMSSTRQEVIQVCYPFEYTQELANARAPVFSELSTTLSEHLGHYFGNGRVVEMGPGVEDIFYQIIGSSDDQQWAAMDINRAVANAVVTKYNEEQGHSTVLGSNRRMPFEDNSVDVVCGMNNLDSVVDFSSVTRELYRVLKDGGYLVHVQDLAPSFVTLALLCVTDDTFLSTGGVGLFSPEMSGAVPLFSHVMMPDQIHRPAHQYLHEGWQKLLERDGFQTVDIGLQTYAMPQKEATDAFTMGNLMFDLPPDLAYSFLVMQKP